MSSIKYIFILIFLFTIRDFKLISGNKEGYLKILNNPTSSTLQKYEANFELGWEYITSSSDTSYIYATKAFMYAKKLNSRYYQGKVFNLLGSYFQTKGIYAKAVDYYRQSLRIGEIINDKDIKLAALGNIGAIYINTSKFDKALIYLSESETLTELDNPNLPNIYNNISIAYNGLHDYTKALSYGERALNLYNYQNNEGLKAMALASIATAQLHLGRLSEALTNFRKSLTIAKLNNDEYQEIDSYSGISKIYFEENKTDSAIFYAQLTSKISLQITQYSSVVEANDLLTKIYKKKKNYEKAFLSQEISNKYKEIEAEISQEQEIESKIIELNFNKRIRVDSLKNAFVLLEKDKKINESQSQIKQDKLFKIATIVFVLLIIGFSVFAYSRFKIITDQKKLIELRNKQTEEQKAIIIQKNKSVTDSINYAKRIQEGLLASDKMLSKNLKDYYTFFKPKDIVSGDFYWSTENNQDFYLAVCDSTGHGVPGAFMALLNIALLSEAIKEKNIKEPHLIFSEVRDRLIEIISADGHKDGFDGVLIRIEKSDSKTLKLHYSAANNEPLLVRDNKIIKLQGDRIPVGKSDELKSFTLFTIDIEAGDTLYLYTDGYADQFGGSLIKKFKRSRLNELLAFNAHLPMDTQWQIINNLFNDWKADEEQIDDVCVLGIKF